MLEKKNLANFFLKNWLFNWIVQANNLNCHASVHKSSSELEGWEVTSLWICYLIIVLFSIPCILQLILDAS